MKKFIIKSSLFVGLCFVVIFLSFKYRRSFDIETDYMATIIDKHYRLEKIDSNRLILVGGSNLAFGINSELIEKEIGKSVINMGLHAGLGIDFIANEAEDIVRKGDVLVFCIDYPLLDKNYDVNLDLINHTQKIYPYSEKYYKLKFVDRFKVQLIQLKKSFDRSLIVADAVYNRKKFNKYGDLIGHLSYKGVVELEYEKPLTDIDVSHSINKINELKQKCIDVGAQFFFVYTNYPQNQYVIDKTFISNLENKLNRSNFSSNIIGSPESFVFDDSLFFDMVYHLNGKGRVARTNILIDLLKKELEN